MLLSALKKWFDTVSKLSLYETGRALIHIPETATAQEALALITPKSHLPHLNPRDHLIKTYVTQPRNTPPETSRAALFMARNTTTKSGPGAPTSAVQPGATSLPQAASSALAQKATTLAELREIVETFEGCPLKTLAQHTVFGDGNPASDIIFVGEAPGAEEDARGLPFVGLSGQLLDRIMRAIGLTRENAYITNILPWRPPGNRQPSTAEITLCLPFVERQIELIKPKLIVCVGGTSAKSLLRRTDGIMRQRGQWLPFQTAHLSTPIPCLATFHPAYLLRSPGQKREAWNDFLMIQEKLHSLREGA